MAENAKNYTTLLYETKKVGIVKLVLFFRFKHFYFMLKGPEKEIPELKLIF